MSDMQSEHSQARSGTQTHTQRSIKAAANVTAVYACFIWDPNDLDWCEASLQNEFGYVWSVKDNPPAYTHTHTGSGHVSVVLMEWSIRGSESSRPKQRGSLSIELEQTLAPGLSLALDSVSSLRVPFCCSPQRLWPSLPNRKDWS